jgi:excisionase family DNA binding protein
MSTVPIKFANTFLSVNEAAELIGCTDGRVRQLLIDGQLKGQKLHARAWVVDRDSADKYAKNTSKVGRPRKFA